MTAAGGNPTGPPDCSDDDDRPGGLLGPDFRSRSGLPVVGIAGCPTHRGWVLETLMALAADLLGPADLDALGRPRFYADRLVPRLHRNGSTSSRPAPKALRPRLHDGAHGLQGHAGACRLQHPAVERRAATAARRPPAFLHRARLQDLGHAFAETPKIAGIPVGLPTDMPKGLVRRAGLAVEERHPRRVRENATADHRVVAPQIRKTGRR